ncbi:unnamed protein product [Caenorhabditis bovis]|uniref:Aminotransferase class I/classII large domain-containing protein n=1 Tax=Caenorhabditis bovis TaxID=2654633 RepID=A0A8S1EER0_9PELO|nr:unnamed protein product [Caenorhabditis bovis]
MSSYSICTLGAPGAAPAPPTNNEDDNDEVNDRGVSKGNFSRNSSRSNISDAEQLDDAPFVSHQLDDEQESFSEKFLRNILTHDYLSLMPRRREKFVEITKTVTVTEVVNGAADKHPSSCEVKVTNIASAGPHPVNVSIKRLHEKYHSCEELDGKMDDKKGKGTVIRIQETHQPYEGPELEKNSYEEVIRNIVEQECLERSDLPDDVPRFDRRSDNIIDLEFTIPVDSESKRLNSNQSGNSTGRRKFADLRKNVTTRTSVTETEKITTTRRSSSVGTRNPEVQQLYYRKYEETSNGDDEQQESDSDSVVIHDDVEHSTRSYSIESQPVAPPRKRLGREESLHYYREDENYEEQHISEYDEATIERSRAHLKSPLPGVTSVSMNNMDGYENLTAGITSVSMNNSCTDTSFESRYSTIPRARSSPPSRVNHIQVNVIGPTDDIPGEPTIIGHTGEDLTMNIIIKRRRSSSEQMEQYEELSSAPPKPPRRTKYDDAIGVPLATSTPFTTMDRKEARTSTDSEPASRKSSRPPDINIISCDDARSPARTPATPIVVVNQTPTSRRSSQDLLSDQNGQRRRKSTVTDIDWYAAFNMKDPSSPAKPPKSPYETERKPSTENKRRSSVPSRTTSIADADIDLNQIFPCTSTIKNDDEKCQCNACQLTKLSAAELERRRAEQRSPGKLLLNDISNHQNNYATLPSRLRTSPVNISLDEIFNINTTRKRSQQIVEDFSAIEKSSPTAEIIDEYQVNESLTNRNAGESYYVDKKPHEADQLLGVVQQDAQMSTLTTMTVTTNKMESDLGVAEKETTEKPRDIQKVPRKLSVTRRISMEELKNDVKNTSRKDSKSPPINITIDDIFEALTPPSEKQFIITKKTATENILAFDSETPTPPPRSAKKHLQREAETMETSTETITINKVTNKNGNDAKDVDLNKQNGEVSKKHSRESLHSIQHPLHLKVSLDEISRQNLEIDAQKANTNQHSDHESLKNVEIEIAFEKHEQESDYDILISQNDDAGKNATEENTCKYASEATINLFGTTIGLDNNKGTPIPSAVNDEIAKHRTIERTERKQITEEPSSSEKPHVSKTTISLDDIFVEGTPRPKSDEDEDKIAQRLKEFEDTLRDKARRTVESDSTTTTRQTVETTVSLDDVFDTKKRQITEEPSSSKKPHVSETTISLDDIFVEGTPRPKSDEDEDKIAQRLKEFEDTLRNKARRTVESDSTTTTRQTVETTVSLDDVFDTKKRQITEEPSSSKKPHVSETTISLDDIFVEGTPRPKSDEDEDKIAQRLKEFEDTLRDKARRTVESDSTTTTRQTVETTVSLDDVFDTMKKKITEEPSSSEKPHVSETTISLDDIFVEGTPGPKSDEDEDKIAQRLKEFEDTLRDKARRTVESDSTTTTRQTVETTVSLDDVFDTKKKKITEEPSSSEKPHVSETTISLDDIFVEGTPRPKSDEDEDKIAQRLKEFEDTLRDKARRTVESDSTTTTRQTVETTVSLDDVFDTKKRQITEEPSSSKKPHVSETTISLDDIFVEGTPRPKSDEDEDKIAQRLKEFEDTLRDKARRTVESDSTTTTRQTVETTVSLDDVFDTKKKKITEEPSSSEKPHVSETTISLDDIFVEGTPRPKSDEDEDKIAQRLKEFEDTLRDKARRTVESDSTTTTRQTVETTVSLDDVFDTKKRQITEEPSSSKKPHVSETTISLDDIFVEGTPRPKSDEDEDKIAQRLKEFEDTLRDKARRTVESDSTTTTRQTVETTVSLDDVFDTKKKQITEEPSSSEKPHVSETTISLDDIFVEGTPRPKSDEDEDKIAQRLKEFEDTLRDKARRTVESDSTTTTRQTVETTVSLDDVFDTKKRQITEEPSSSKKPHVSETTISLDDIFVEGTPRPMSDEDEDKIAQRLKEFEDTLRDKARRTVESDSTTTTRQTVETTVSLDDVFDTMKKKITEEPSSSEKPHVSETTISLDDIFVEGTPGPKSDEDEDKIAQRLKEFEDTLRDKARRTVESDSTTTTRQTVETTVSLDDVFDTKKKQITEEPSSSEKPHVSETTISLDDIFVEGTPRPKSDEDEDKIAQRLKEFEDTLRDKARRTVESDSTTTTRQTVETTVSLDDVFDTKKRQITEEPSSSKKPHVSETTISLDDIFVEGTPRPKSDEDEDKIAQRLKEFEDTLRDKARRTVESDSTTTTRQTVETTVSLDDVFDTKKRQITEEPSSSKKPHVSETTISLDDIFVEGTPRPMSDEDEDKIAQRLKEFEDTLRDKARRTVESDSTTTTRQTVETTVSLDDVFDTMKKKITEEPSSSEKPHVSETTISLDDIFVEGTPGPKSDEDEDKIAQRLKEFEDTLRDKARRTVESDSTTTTRQTVETTVSLDDVFDTKKKQITEEPSSSEKPHVSETTISLDDIFVEGTPRPKSDEDEDKIAQRLKEFEDTLRDKARRTVESDSTTTTRQTVETTVSLDDVFDTKKRQITEEPSSSKKPHVSETTISLDDIFVEGTPRPKSDEDEDKIAQRLKEFEDTLRDKARRTVESDSTTTTRQTVETTVSLDDVFDTKKKQITEEPSSSKKPHVSETTISLDDIFVEGTPRPKSDEDEDSKIAQRLKEFEDTLRDKARRTVESDSTTTTRQTVETTVSLDDVFDTKKRQITEEPSSSKKPHVSETTISLDDIFVEGTPRPKSDEDEDKIAQRLKEFEDTLRDKARRTVESDSTTTTRQTVETTVSLDDVFDTKKRQITEEPSSSKKPHVSETTISLDDIFVEGTPRPKSDEDEDKIAQRLKEFEDTLRDKARRTVESDSTTTTRQTVETTVSLDDVFDTKKRQITEEPSSSKKPLDPLQAIPEIRKVEHAPTVVPINFDLIFPSNNDLKNIESNDDIRENIANQLASNDDGANGFATHTKGLLHASESSVENPADREHENSLGLNFTIRDVKSSSVPEINVSSDDNNSLSFVEKLVGNGENAFNEEPKTNVQSTPSNSIDILHQKSASTPSNIIASTELRNIDHHSTSQWHESIMPASKLGLENSFYHGRTQDAKPIETPPNSESDSENVPKYRKQMNVEIDLNEIFSSPPTTDLGAPQTERKIDQPSDDFISKVVEETPKTPHQQITNECGYSPSPTRVSSEIKYEWVSDAIQPDDKVISDISFVSSVVYRPPSSPYSYTIRNSRVEPESLVMPSTSSWLEDLLVEMKAVDDAEKRHSGNSIDLDEVFRSFECVSVDGEKCNCSACRLAMLSDDELQMLKMRWKTQNKIEPAKNATSSSEYFTRPTQNAIDIPLDQIFNPQMSASIDAEFTKEIKAEIIGNKSEPSTLCVETVYQVPIDENLHIATDDIPIPSTSSPPINNTISYAISPKVVETVTREHRWKNTNENLDKSEINLDKIYTMSPLSDESRRFSTYYEDRSGWETVRSEDSGVASAGRRWSTKHSDKVVDEAFNDIFEQNSKSDLPYDDYYITSLNEETNSDGPLDVSQFVDDILGKSLDEAAFLASQKRHDFEHHPYYRKQTDTSIDKRSKPIVIEEIRTDEVNNFATTSSDDEIIKLIFDKNSQETVEEINDDEEVASSSYEIVTNVTTTKFIEINEKLNNEEYLEIVVRPSFYIVQGSYYLVINKNDPLGLLLQKIQEKDGNLATLDFSLTRKLKRLIMSCIREKALNMRGVEGVSYRGQYLISSDDYASSTFHKMNANKYDAKRNPEGIVNFCTAENNICTPLLQEQFKHLELFIPNTEHLVRYPPSGGWPEPKLALKKYFAEFMKADVDEGDLVLTASTRTGYDVVSYCLFEADDILLTTGPVYSGTVSNCNERAHCVVESVPVDLENPKLDVSAYQKAFEDFSKKDCAVKGVVIVNPHNPLGVVFPPEQVIELCNWAARTGLHVIIDEVFANCVFEKQSRFKSYLSYRHKLLKSDNVAYLWSVSKDFGLPGLKFAVIHTTNESLRRAATKLQMYHPCSPFASDFAVKLLSDFDWLHSFHTEVNRRIRLHYEYTAANLDRLEIPFVKAEAGIFVFADLSKHLSSLREECELELWNRFAEGGVMLTPGVHQKCHAFGWYRLVYACSLTELIEGIRRLYQLLGSPLEPLDPFKY